MASSGAAEVVIDVSSSLLLASPPMRLISALRLERAAFLALKRATVLMTTLQHFPTPVKKLAMQCLGSFDRQAVASPRLRVQRR
jgi:hypothetical protein